MLVRPLGIKTSRQKEILKKSHRKRALLHPPGTVLAVTTRSPRTERSEMTPEQHQIDQLLEYLVDKIAINKNYWKKRDSRKWSFRGLSSKIKKDGKRNKVKNFEFKINSRLEYKQSSMYLTVGKGFP